MIIGAQKCGTTSLHNYLTEHPLIAGGFPRKELHFFDINYQRGTNWYRVSFPTRGYAQWMAYRRGARVIVGESSPYYLFHPGVPKRMRALLPEAKLIVLLRNPADRAISHYSHSVRRGYETLDMRQAFAVEEERLKGTEERLVNDPNYRSFEHQHNSYLSRGRYAEQLERWFAHYPREQMMIVRSEDFFSATQQTVDGICRFLGCEPAGLAVTERYNQFPYQRAAPEIYEWLEDYYAPHNQRLAGLLGSDLGWS